MKTHNHATFVVLATDGDDLIIGLTENGEAALGTFDRFEWVDRHLTSTIRECIDGDRPLVIVIGKNKTRATAGEVFLEKLARAIVRREIPKYPDANPVYIAGRRTEYVESYLHPRVISTPLAWAPKSVALGTRVHRFLDELAFTETGSNLLPNGETYYVGE
jgi:hypothetical protein